MNNERLQWFRARVGKTVYVNELHGFKQTARVLVVDDVIAQEFYQIEKETTVRFFDTPEEVIEHEKTLKG